MYINEDQLRQIKVALQYLPKGEAWNKITASDRVAITNAFVVLSELENKRICQNQKVNEYIKEKRKTDPNYGRSKREIQKCEEAARKRAARKALKEYTGTQEIQSMYPQEMILDNTCYHCNYFRLLDGKGNGHCLHRDTRCGFIHSLDSACEHFEKEIVKNVCTKHCEDCASFYNIDGCANNQICLHPDNRMYLIEGSYEACIRFQPKTN